MLNKRFKFTDLNLDPSLDIFTCGPDSLTQHCLWTRVHIAILPKKNIKHSIFSLAEYKGKQRVRDAG